MVRAGIALGVAVFLAGGLAEAQSNRRGYGASPFSPGSQNHSHSPNFSGPGSQNLSTSGNWGMHNHGNNWGGGGSNSFTRPHVHNHSTYGNNSYQGYYSQPQGYYYTQPQYGYSTSPNYSSTPRSAPPAPSYASGYTPQVAYSNLPILISMPEGEPGSCSYTLTSGGDTWNYSMVAGQSQTFLEDRAWKLTFNRGSGFGQQTYSLKPGLYRFRQSSRGWELYRGSDTPTLSTAPLAPIPAF